MVAQEYHILQSIDTHCEVGFFVADNYVKSLAIKPTHCIKLCVVKLCVGKSRGSSSLPLLSPTMPFLGASVVLIIKPVFTLKLLCCWCGTVSCNSHHHSSFDSWRKYKSELFKAKPKPFRLTSTSSSRVDLSYMLNPDIGEDIAIVLEAAYVAINQFVVSPDQSQKSQPSETNEVVESTNSGQSYINIVADRLIRCKFSTAIAN